MSLSRAASSILLVCDVQERFRPLIHRFPAVVRSARALLRGAAALGVPVIATEQNPSRLGATVDELAADLRGARARVHAKLRFSMLAEGVELGASTAHAFLCGIEAHVCVAQTASDLLARGIAVSIVVDGVSSQRRGDRAVALQSLAAAGARLTTTEAALFWLLEDASHARFKDVQRVAIDFAKEYKEAGEDAALDHL